MSKRELLDYEMAKSFAQSVARDESSRLHANKEYAIMDDNAIQHPWGWAFAPMLTSTDKSMQSTVVNWGITVDRFNGKVLIVGRKDVENDDLPNVKLTLHGIGETPNAVYRLLRQLMGWTAIETKQKMSELPIVLRTGPTRSIRAIHETFNELGAETTLQLIDG